MSRDASKEAMRSTPFHVSALAERGARRDRRSDPRMVETFLSLPDRIHATHELRMKQLPGPIGSCEDDPIHSPGAVQSHGAMRVCSADLRVVATSESDEADSRELSQLTAVLRGSVA